MEKFYSRKFFVAVAIFALEFLRPFGLNLPTESEQTLMIVAVAYLGGQSFVDAVQALATKKQV